MSVAQWAETYRYLSEETTALPGKFSLTITPYLRGILESLTLRVIRKVVCQKSAQIAWTDGVINNFLGRMIHMDPAPTILMFPRDQTAKDYNAEKFIPMVEATPVLAGIVDVRSRSAENTQNRKKFRGGFLKLIGSNSTGGVKSTPAKYAIIEEPDDCNLNIRGQGDSIKLLEERIKTFFDHKVIAGGTPSIKGVSSIEAEMEASDKRRFMVPCHGCGESHALTWDNVSWRSDETQSHPVFGHALPETTAYACPHCGLLWNNAEKNRNVRKGEWIATAPFRGVAGFYLNELYSPFIESRLERLVEKFLTAEFDAQQGDIGPKIAFWNSSLGLPWEYQSGLPKHEDLQERAEDYAEFTVPWGGLVLTAGVDVQHDRLAVILRAWGRGEESWLVYWGEIYGQTIVPEQGAWVDLDALLEREFEHASGAKLKIRAGSIDSGDGQTADAVYAFVRKRQARGLRAVKGASTEGREIFSQPKPVLDIGKRDKAMKFGVRPYIVGVDRAKDLLLGADSQAGRIKLAGSGPGRIHWYRSVRPDYWEQLTAEIKVPHRIVRGKKVWQKKAGAHNEALDAEIYAFHAARALKTNLYKEARWAWLEAKIRQHEIFAPAGTEVVSDETPADALVADHPAMAPPAERDAVKSTTPAFNTVKPQVQTPTRPRGFVTHW